MANKWKTVAIILIIVLIIENLLLFWLFSIGNAEIKKENECRQIICQDYDAFYYSSASETCYCYLDDEIAHREVIK